MAYLNMAVILGNLTKDSELRFLPGEDTAVLSFTIAATKPKKDKEKEKPFFIGVTVWGEYAKAMESHLKKGRQVIVTGEMEYSSWESDGNYHSKHTIKADSIQLMSKPKDKSDQSDDADGDEADAGTNEKAKKQTKK